MDKNGTMTIDWNEWKKHPTLQPAENIPEIILYWKHSTVSILTQTLHSVQIPQNNRRSLFSKSCFIHVDCKVVLI